MLNKIKISAIFTAAVLLTFLSAAQAQAKVDIIFPNSDNVKAVSDIHIVGKSSSDAPVTVDINGEKSTRKLIPTQDPDGIKYYMLMTILKLQPDNNTITITQGKDTQVIKILKVSSPSVITDWTERYQYFHSSKDREVCLNCHKFQNLSDCANCHRDKLMGQWVHAPVKELKCFTCHEKDNNFIPQEPFSTVCLTCHADFNKKLKAAEYVHGPVAAGFCTICHSPHKSTDKTHLRKPVNQLCNECHSSGEMGFNYHQDSSMKFHPVSGVIIKKLNREITCADCHSPHYSSDPLMLSSDSVPKDKLCSKCHDENTAALLKILEEKNSTSK